MIKYKSIAITKIIIIPISDNLPLAILYNYIKMSAQKNIKTFLLLILLIFFAHSTCTSTSSSLQYIITGVMQIGLPNQSYAQTQYNVVFSGSSSLGTTANIFYAFALAGFQTPGNQNYYSLSVDQVYFTNANTAMTVLMNYANAANTVSTQWSKVIISYLLVSQQFGGVTSPNYFGNSYLWAGTVQLTPPKTNQPVDNNPIFSNSNSAGTCGYINSFPPVFGTNCPSDAKVLYHYYVMGFQYDSSVDTSYQIRFSVRGGAGTDNNEADLSLLIQTGITPNGAYMTIPNFNGYLDMIKVAMVIVVIRDYATYPTQNSNPQNFKYSGIFMPLSTFNSAVSVTQGTTYNLNHFDITTAQFMLYGFSSINIGTSSGSVDVQLSLQNLYNVQLTSANSLSNVLISGDLFNSDVTTTCSPNPTQMTNVISQQYSSIPYLSAGQQTVSRIASSAGIIPGYSNEYVFDVWGYSNGNTDTLNFFMNITYNQLTAGDTYEIIIGFDEMTATNLPNNAQYTYIVQVNGQTVFLNTVTTTPGLDNTINKVGLNINSTTVLIGVAVSFSRSTSVTQHFRLDLDLLQFDVIYDSTNNCCATACPPQTGINLNVNPPTCVSCSSGSGMYFNLSLNQCACLSGYYLVSGTSQSCSPCTVSLCASCRPDGPYRCLTCVGNATLDTFYENCTCNSGYYQNNNLCVSNSGSNNGNNSSSGNSSNVPTLCSYRCASCTTTGLCITCADSTHRNINNSCNCISGYFDSGSANCVPCSTNCQTCTSSSFCTSCLNGYYQNSNSNGNSICSQCSPQCSQCTGNAYTCTFCNATLNLIPGYDSTGHLTCVCSSGYILNSNGTCYQSSCTNDPLCASCQVQPGGSSVCVLCNATLNRILQTPQYTCVCQSGFYQNSNNICVACASGCATCNSSSACISCVPSATMVNSQSCQCPVGTYFATTPTRYCQACDPNCANCSSSGSCNNCINGFNLAQNGSCTCGLGNYVSGSQCLACSAGCQTCSDVNTCTSCITNMTLQNGTCVQRCSIGYYKSGTQCLTCNSGCVYCTNSKSCQICGTDTLLYNGNCYTNCPSGTVSDSTNSTCVACNPPCATCTQHPSTCTSCLSGAGNLYNGNCTTQCVSGTYAFNNVCQICDFSCAECVGTSTTCTACPSGQILSNNQCLGSNSGNNNNSNSSFNCQSGYYQSGFINCTRCNSSCKSCNSTQCLSCISNFLLLNGACVNACPSNTYATVNQTCQSCDVSCNQCTGTSYQCLACAAGYTFYGTQCVIIQNCRVNQYFNYNINQCSNCSNQCLTCSAQAYCTSCNNGQVPSNGVCPTINCPVNCLTCSSTTVCTSCVQGFYLQNASCVLACSYPYSPINGVCQCGSGFFYNNSCVQTCPSGYAAISKDCLPCDPSCLQCSQKVTYCTSCQTGYNFNSATNICEIASTTCPYGQYYQSGYCYRSCSPTTYYQGGFCFYSCSPGYQDNGYGGCVNSTSGTTVTGCGLLFNSSGICVSQCPSGTYPDSKNICQSCSSNCTSCQNNTSCITCASGFTLTSGSCIIAGTCLNTQVQYNNTCLASCPIGNIATNGICQRICTTGQYYYNTRCYSPCPTTLRTVDACVDVCPSGYAQTTINNVLMCVNASTIAVTCSFGYYYNQTLGQCANCVAPCASCQDSSVCFTCNTGYTLVINQCIQQSYSGCTTGYYQDVSGSCFACSSQCATCTSLSSCQSCVSGYTLSASNCIISSSSGSTTIPSNLPQFTGITVQQTYLRGTSVIVSLVLTVVPSSLPSAQTDQFFNVLTSSGVNTIIDIIQWQDSSNHNIIWVMVDFGAINGSSFLFLSIKASVMGSSYAALGYSINQNNYKAVSVYQTLPPAPSNIQAPSSQIAIPYNRSNNIPSS